MPGSIGFIGLDPLGETICRHLLRKSGRKVVAFDVAAEPVGRIVGEGAAAAKSVADVIGSSEITFLRLPSAKHVLSAFENGILHAIRGGQTVIDLNASSTSESG